MTTKLWRLAALAITMNLALIAAPGTGNAGVKAKLTLAATGIEAAARGKAALSIVRGSSGRFKVSVLGLAREADYDLVVGGIKVLALHTNRGGRAKVRFSTTPRGHDVFLGFDPRGQLIEVRNGNGAAVLSGTMPAVGIDDEPQAVTCCVPDDRGAECEDRTVADCTALGGVVTSAPSCLPDPCTAVPPADRDVVCCVPDDEGAECEDRTQAECLAENGSIVEATSCDPNPCLAAPSPVASPSPTPLPTAAPTASPAPTPSAAPTAAPTPSPTPLPTAAPSPSPTVDPNATCEDRCWNAFLSCLSHCTTTYCAPFCQVDLGRCFDFCPAGQ